MVDELTKHMDDLYSKPDPWNYKQANRHAVTAGFCQQFFSRGCVKRVLELGCGEGLLAKELWYFLGMPEYVGVEMNSDAIARAVMSGAEMDIENWSIVCSDLREGVPSVRLIGMFDLIVASDSLPYIPDHADQVVKDAYDHLNPGGTMVLTSWINGNEYGPCFGDGPEDAEIKGTLHWTGSAMDAEGLIYPSEAVYLALGKPA